MAIEKISTYSEMGKINNSPMPGASLSNNDSKAVAGISGIFQNLIETVRTGEEAQKLAAAGKIDEITLMKAVTQADLAIQTGVTLVGKLTEALQGIDKIIR